MADIGRDELMADLRRLQPRLVATGVTGLALIGSRARADNRPDSDVDLLIDVDDTRKFSLLDLVGVGHIVEDETGVPANVFMRRSLSESFMRTTSRDELRVF